MFGYPSLLDLTIFRTTYEKIDSISDAELYADEISPKLLNLECLLHPVCSMEMMYHFPGYLKCPNHDQEPFEYEREIQQQEGEGKIMKFP